MYRWVSWEGIGPFCWSLWYTQWKSGLGYYHFYYYYSFWSTLLISPCFYWMVTQCKWNKTATPGTNREGALLAIQNHTESIQMKRPTPNSCRTMTANFSKCQVWGIPDIYGTHLRDIIRIISRGVSGLATDSPCSVWGRGWTTCLLHDSPLFGSHFKMRVGM